MYDQTYAPSKDAPKNPSISFDDNVIHLTRHDPYGHIYLSLERGELPEKYRGAYTMLPIAEHEARKYIAEREETAKLIFGETKKSKK